MFVGKMRELEEGVLPLFVGGFIGGHGEPEDLAIGGSEELGMGNLGVFERDLSGVSAADKVISHEKNKIYH